MLRTMPALPVFLAALLLAAADGEEARYAACLEEARRAPETTLAKAKAWEEAAGAEPAEHCLAVALLSAGRYEAAAERLEGLATRLSGTPKVNALAQAGQAWLLAGAPERAYAAQSAALLLAPENLELLIDRALTLADWGRTGEALADLDAAAERAPQRADVAFYRALALRRLGRPGEALAALEQALTLAPDYPEALLERGLLRSHTGDLPGAAADWERVLRLDPEGAAGAAARSYLEALARAPG